MNKLILFGVLISTSYFSTTPNAVAAGDNLSRVSKSSGYVRSTEKNTEQTKIEATRRLEPLVRDGTKKPRSTKQISKNGSVFWIYDAYALLNFDEDGDGFHHNFSVVFDADVDSGINFVYADLYLSLDGGPWNYFFTTNVFSIDGSTSLDEYEVDTELNSGYPTGYYDVLIELVDADTDELVASADDIDFAGLSALPLEDSGRDFVPSDVVSVGYGGGGALGYAVLLLAMFATVGRRKNFSGLYKLQIGHKNANHASQPQRPHNS